MTLIEQIHGAIDGNVAWANEDWNRHCGTDYFLDKYAGILKTLADQGDEATRALIADRLGITST